jgi:hypothetical protein
MALGLEAGPEKAGGIVIETGSVQTLITGNALIDEATKGLLSEMIEIENLLVGGMIVRLAATVA